MDKLTCIIVRPPCLIAFQYHKIILLVSMKYKNSSVRAKSPGWHVALLRARRFRLSKTIQGFNIKRQCCRQHSVAIFSLNFSYSQVFAFTKGIPLS